MGERYYAPTQQTEGVDFDTVPDLTRYMAEIGKQLDAHADRPPASLGIRGARQNSAPVRLRVDGARIVE